MNFESHREKLTKLIENCNEIQAAIYNSKRKYIREMSCNNHMYVRKFSKSLKSTHIAEYLIR